MGDNENLRLLFDTTLSSIEEGELLLRDLHGIESISTLYDFDLTLECTREGGLHLDVIDELFQGGISVGFGTEALRRVSGVLSHIELVEMSPDAKFSLYRAELRPRLWRTTLVHRSRCFVATSIPDVIRAVLAEHELNEGDGFEFRITEDDYPVNEDGHVVQYEETDFNFLSRWMERLGMFYFFEQTDSGELLVIADRNGELAEAPENPELTYSYEQMIYDQGSISSLRRMTRARPEAVTVRDYNWREEANTGLVQGRAPIDEAGGYGIHAYYGRHVPTDDAAEKRAIIRAETIACAKHLYGGYSVNEDLWPGQKIKVVNSPAGEYDLEYVLTTVIHQATYGEGSGTYSNTMEMINYAYQYRAPLRAPWPRISGVMHARIDYDDISSVAPIDKRGRYRVLLPYDFYGTFGGTPSRWIRKAEAYAGPRQGMHFTLHAGSEVLLAHIDGDPDRPLIVGSVPNDADRSPLNSEEPTRHAIRTRSGIVIDFEDDAG